MSKPTESVTADIGKTSQSKVVNLRCKHCNGINLLRLPETAAVPRTDSRKVADEAIRRVLEWLTRNARDPERIGKRVQQLAFEFKRNDEREKLSTLAKMQGCSRAHACRAVEEASQLLREVRNINFDSRA